MRFSVAERALLATSIVVLSVQMPTPAASGGSSAASDPQQRLEKVDTLMRGESQDMTLSMEVKTKSWQRQYKFRLWMKGKDNAFCKVTEPAKVAGQTFLRLKTRMWNYFPNLEKTVLIPPSMMLDRFMGSDFSNDDFIKMSYFARDYTAKITGEEVVDGFQTVRMELTPKEDAAVAYAKLEMWLRKDDSAPVILKFFNDKLEHSRTLHYSQFRTFSKHDIPTVWKMKNEKESDRETVITVKEAAFDMPLSDSLFTRENLTR